MRYKEIIKDLENNISNFTEVEIDNLLTELGKIIDDTKSEYYKKCIIDSAMFSSNGDDIFIRFLQYYKNYVSDIADETIFIFYDHKDVGCYVKYKDNIFKVKERESIQGQKNGSIIYDRNNNKYEGDLCEPSSLKEFRKFKLRDIL